MATRADGGRLPVGTEWALRDDGRWERLDPIAGCAELASEIRARTQQTRVFIETAKEFCQRVHASSAARAAFRRLRSGPLH